HGHVAALCDAAANQTYNLDGSEKVTILRIAETVLRLTGSRNQIEFMPARAGDYAGRDVSTNKAQRELNWVPEIDFEEGMKRTVPWLVEQLSKEAVAAASDGCIRSNEPNRPNRRERRPAGLPSSPCTTKRIPSSRCSMTW